MVRPFSLYTFFAVSYTYIRYDLTPDAFFHLSFTDEQLCGAALRDGIAGFGLTASVSVATGACLVETDVCLVAAGVCLVETDVCLVAADADCETIPQGETIIPSIIATATTSEIYLFL